VEGDNWLSIWALQASLETARRAVEEPERAHLLDRIQLGADSQGQDAPSRVPKLHGAKAEEVTYFVLEGRRLLREHYQKLQTTGDPGKIRHHLFPVALPAMAQFRTTRRIVGRTTLQAGQHSVYDRTSTGLVADWRTKGEVWEIPYDTLIPQRITGLIAAGRCISSHGDAWEVTRVIPAAALTGQVAGLAAALAVRNKTTPDRLPVEHLQARLERAGIPLHLSDVNVD
jgi:hypothetical protein